MHRLLKRQLRRLKLDTSQPPSAEEWQSFVDVVNTAYEESDQARRIQERALNVSSDEMRNYYHELKDSENRLQQFFAASGEAIFFHDNGVVLDVNDQLTDMLGYEREDVIGQNILQYVAPEFKELAIEHMSKGLEDAYEIDILTKSGHLIPVVVTARTMDTQDKKIRLVAIQDVSRLKAAQQELELVNDELEQRVTERTSELVEAIEFAEEANRAKSMFLTSMSHELRTPLNSILGFSQLMKLDEELSNENQEFIDHMEQAGHHLLALINDVLDLSKIEAGKMELSTEEVDLVGLLKECHQIMQPVAEERHVSIEMKTGEPVTVIGDAMRIKQVLLNLLSNAVKYNRMDGWVLIEYKLSGDNVDIGILDSGVGIDEKDKEKVFDSFVRLSKANEFGAGVGLNITAQLVAAMDGSIRLDSQKGKGSQFWVTLPIKI